MKFLSPQDTIAAQATAQGLGGIGIIRISGPKAWAVGRNIFRRSDGGKIPQGEIRPRTMQYGCIVNDEGRQTLDQVLCVFFQGPHSFTGEDSLEIQGHGGPAVMAAILDTVLEQGCRQAGPGEFTLRAFLNGRLDLSQAEAVAQLIEAQGTKQARMALASLRGGLSDRLAKIRAALVELAARLEAAIDFPDELDEIIQPSSLERLENQALITLRGLLEEHQRRRVFAQGALVVLCGRPNVGKSSLFNRILGRKRALVYERPGTTRDSLEESVSLGGVVCRLVDTAGLGSAGDEVEALGMGLARDRLETADLCLVLLDGSQAPQPEDQLVLQTTREKPRLVVANKADLGEPPDLTFHLEPGEALIKISAKTGQGLDRLMASLREKLTGGQAEPLPGQSAANDRQAKALGRCLEAAERAKTLMRSPEPQVELASVELEEALAALSEVDGQGAPDELLEAIFSRFCVGK